MAPRCHLVLVGKLAEKQYLYALKRKQTEYVQFINNYHFMGIKGLQPNFVKSNETVGQGNHQTGLGLIELKSVFVSWFGRVNINFKWNWISFGRKYLKCLGVSLQMFSKWTFEPGWSNNALINQLETKYVTRNRKNNNLLLLKWKAYYCTSLRPK